jgi:hypothetical protein
VLRLLTWICQPLGLLQSLRRIVLKILLLW